MISEVFHLDSGFSGHIALLKRILIGFWNRYVFGGHEVNTFLGVRAFYLKKGSEPGFRVPSSITYFDALTLECQHITFGRVPW